MAKADFISADEAWAEWAPENIGEDYQEVYTENPLEGMDNNEIYMKDVSRQQDLVTWLESVSRSPGSAPLRNGGHDFDRVNAIVAYVSVGIIAILLAVSIFLINNTW